MRLRSNLWRLCRRINAAILSICRKNEWLNQSQISIPNAAWLFGPVPPDDNQPGYDPINYTTPCTGCSVSEVTTIAQPTSTYNADGSYFGIDSNGYNAINWLEVAFGNWQFNCEPGTTLCTFNTDMGNPNSYYGGPQYYPNNIVSGSNYSTTAYGPYETYDGIALPGGGGSYSGVARKPAGAFNEPLPPAPIHTPYPRPTIPPYPCPGYHYARHTEIVWHCS